MKKEIILDLAIRDHECTNSQKSLSGYDTTQKVYDNYLNKALWEDFLETMKTLTPAAYKNYTEGGGKELEERKVGNNTYPPKMACFGSSSRLLYNLMKNNRQFEFEKKLHTSVGGTANLDGFMKTDDKYYFVEAKCREPYSPKTVTVSESYTNLYKAITKSKKTPLCCAFESNSTAKTGVSFYYGNDELLYFDIKQMICHLLGIGTAFLNRNFEKKEIEFVYVVFDPRSVGVTDKTICGIYDKLCKECTSIDFKPLFFDILRFLQTEKKLGKDKDILSIADSFSFVLCNFQNIPIPLN